MISLTEDKRMLEYELLNAYPDISHFVTTRYGGCSEGAYATFNCSPFTGDDTACVAQNQQRLLDGMKHHPLELFMPRQVHGTEILVIDSAFRLLPASEKERQQDGIDALITNVPGCCVCVSTADCVPILLYDKGHKAVAAVHAGWRGTVNSILALTLERMKREYATEAADLIACIGPGISLESFEVGEDVWEAFRQKGFKMACISRKNSLTQKWHIDLWEANRLQLSDFGVAHRQIELAGLCTYKEDGLFFSARQLGIESGRNLSGIFLHC